MDEIEIQIFDEITNYKEKLGWFTIRQWIFIVLIAITVIPTYIFLPKVLGEDLTSYIILIEAAGIGFIGFVPVHNLPAEKIIPFWFRHYFLFHKPLEYMTTQEYKELKEQKKNRKHNKVIKEEKDTIENTVTEPLKATEPITDVTQQATLEQEKKPTEATTEPVTAKRPKKQKLTKEEKALMKAKKKYGYLFKEEDANVVVVEPEKEYQEMSKNIPEIPVDENGVINPFTIKPVEDKALEQNITQEQQQDNNVDIQQDNTSSESEELNDKFNSLTDEEKKVLLKLLGK